MGFPNLLPGGLDYIAMPAKQGIPRWGAGRGSAPASLVGLRHGEFPALGIPVEHWPVCSSASSNPESASRWSLTIDNRGLSAIESAAGEG